MKIETEEEKKWFDSRPTLIKNSIKKFPDGPCYKIKDTKGHYGLYSFAENLRTGACTVKMVHLDDSWGSDGENAILVFGLDPDTIQQCGCLN